MITILAIGKKHEDWVTAGIERYERRLQPPYDVSWQLLPHSAFEGELARREESHRMLERIPAASYMILLDERGKKFTSPAFSKLLDEQFTHSPVTFVIGGAYGVTEELATKADLIISLSDLVFPHQLVRLVVVEQIYRAQMIAHGSRYHHV
jgi:23S rRNA (pseudouridine1915-N3)-methyltransferase